MSDAATLPPKDARTAPVAIWGLLENIKGDDLLRWRMEEPAGRASVAERNLDYPFPYGWFPALLSADLAPGEVKPLRYMGRDLAIWRGHDGKPRMLDAYCQHLGAHMGYGGKVSGDLLECPFHAWRYDGEGAVKAIPYSETIPPRLTKACDRPWRVAEANRWIWFWYHPFGEPPAWELEHFAETSDPEWSDYEIHEWYVWGTLQNMAENGVDAAHFKYVHGTATFPEYVMNWDGVRRSSHMDAKLGTPKGEVDGRIASGMIGPGQNWTRFTGISETLLVAAITPVEHDKLHVRFCFTQPKAQVEGLMGKLAKALIRDICKQVDQDKMIWDRQQYRPRPVICGGDGPILLFRKWYSQFYAELAGEKAAP